MKPRRPPQRRRSSEPSAGFAVFSTYFPQVRHPAASVPTPSRRHPAASVTATSRHSGHRYCRTRLLGPAVHGCFQSG